MQAVGSKAQSNSDKAVEEMRRMIFSGELAAGSNHLETELANLLGMSRTPVREASLVLENQGLIEVRPRKGIRVLPVSPTDMREVYDVLTELESLAAAQAAQQGYTVADLETLGAAVNAMDIAIANNDLDAWAAADDAFHTELVRLSPNTRIQSIVGMMADQVRRARTVTLHMRETPHTSNEAHRAVYDAIKNGNPETARRVHYDHRATAREALLSLLEKYRLISL